MSTLVDRKLTDLRVVELKNELEKRGLDKTGVKALLVSRLQEALVSEGRNPSVYTFKVVEDGPRKSARKSRDDTEKTPEEEEEEEEIAMEANDCFYEGSEEAEYRADSDAPDDLAAAGVTYGSSADGSERTGGDYDEEETIEDDEESHLTSGRYEGRSQENYSVLDYGSEENLDSVELNDSSVECPVAETGVCEDVNKASSVGESKKDEGGAGSSSGGNAEAQGTAPKGTEKAACTGSSLWVTGIPPKSRAADVKELVGKYGRVHLAKIVTCANAPGSKCFAFVTMFTPEEADKCVQELNHTEMNGKRIVVERAKSDRLVTSKLHSAVKKSGTGQTVVVKKAATQLAGGAPNQTPSATTAPTSTTSTESGQEAAAPCKETNAANATAAVGENGKDSKREEQSSKEGRRAGEWGSGDIDGGRSKEKKRSTSRTHDGRYRRRSRSRTRSRSSGRHHRGREEFGGGFRMHTAPMRGMGFRRPLGRGGYPMRRPMRGPYPPRYPGSSGSRFYDDRRDVEYEKMRMREKEYMQREEMLRIEREKARLRADRERLEREKLELQQQRMRMGYDGGPGGGMAGSGGMKRMYDTSPYPPTKRVAYATAPGGYDTRMPPSRDRVSTGYRRPEYPEGREVRRPPADRYEYRGDRYGGGGGGGGAGRTGGGDHRSGPRMAGIGGSARGGASGAMGRSDGRRLSPPSSMPRRGRPSAAWEGGGSGGRSGGGYGAHSSGGGGGPGGWMDSVDRGSAGAGGGGGGGGWNRGPGAGGSTWGTGCFGSGGSGGGDGQYGSGERFDNYGNGKYSGSINRRY